MGHADASDLALRKSPGPTSPPVTVSIRSMASQDGSEMPRLIRLICDCDRETFAPNSASVMSSRVRYCSRVMRCMMHAMHMHVKQDMHPMPFK